MNGTSGERTGMRTTRSGFAIVAGGVIAAGMSTGTAWADGPGGVIENLDDISVAVGTGVFGNDLVGFLATGDTNEEAAANVIAECQGLGGVECTSDMASNEEVCVVSVADPVNYVVVGGAGVTLSVALQDASQEGAANNAPGSVADAVVVISDCSWDE